MSGIKVAVIGFGNMGTAHATCLAEGKIRGLELAAVCDIRPERLAESRRRFPGVARFADYRELLASGGAQAAVVAVPHPLHGEIASAALGAGLHTLVEKPMEVSVTKARRLAEDARKSGKVFAIMLNQRTNPLFRKAREIVQGGELGEMKRTVWIITNWYRTQFYYDSGSWRATWKGEGGGVLYNQAPHNIDLFQWIPDMMPNKVHAFCHFGKWHNIEVEDDVTAYFEYPNGATGVFITTTGDAPGTNRFEICGDRGKLVYEGDKLTFVKTDVSIKEYTYTTESTFSPPAMQNIEVKVEGDNPQHVGILNNFANAILDIEPLYAPASDGIKGVTLANAMLLSGWTGETVELPLDGKKFYDMLQQHIKDSKFVKVTAEDTGTADLSSTYNSK